MIHYEQSLALLKAQIKTYTKIEKIALTQCLGRILAEDIRAKKPYPQCKIAAMDGYAFKFKDQNKALKIVGSVKTGSMSKITIKANECIKTYTGSIIAKGCDSLVPVEKVKIKDNYVYIKEKVSKGFAIRKRGESYEKDTLLLQKGTRLNFSEIALLAELGLVHISVFIKPVVGILSSGDELKDLGECLENKAQIYSSNHLALANFAKSCGAEALVFPLIKDDKLELQTHLKNALQSCDIVISTGGVSMGDFDFLKELIKEYECFIDKVSIKPGRHIKIAKFGDKFILALPGFAYSALITFALYARTILNTWLLQKTQSFQAFFKGSYTKKSPYIEFLACNLSFKEGKIYADFEGKKQGSSAIITNLNAQSAILKLEKTELKNNELVDIILLA